MTPRRILALGLVLLAAFAHPHAARADAPTIDGVYGRLRADTVFSLEAGGGLAVVDGGARGLFAATARMRYLDSAGFALGYQNAPGATRYDALSLAVDVRPLTLARILSNLEHGPRWTDLALDSLGLEIGVAWIRPGDAFGNGSGLGLLLGGGVEFPLAWSEGNALMLRLGVRWLHSTVFDSATAGPGSDAVLFSVSLVGRLMARLGLVGNPL